MNFKNSATALGLYSRSATIRTAVGSFVVLVGSFLFSADPLQGFVLLGNKRQVLSGSPGATSGQSSGNPSVSLFWNGSAPEISHKAKFAEGRYAGLDDHAFMRVILTEAMSIWNEVPASFLKMELLEDPTMTIDGEDGRHTIGIEYSDNVTTSAYAAPLADEDRPGFIKDCDIVIANRQTKARNLAYTIAHELGHCIGLGHNHTNYDAMMGYSRSDLRLRLGADDIAGLVYLYPDSSYTGGGPKELVGCSTIGSMRNEDRNVQQAPFTKTLGIAFFLLMLPAVLVLGQHELIRRRTHDSY